MTVTGTTRLDRLIIIVLLIFSLGTWLLLDVLFRPGRTAVLIFDGHPVKEFVLSDDFHGRIDLGRGWISVQVENGRIRLDDSSCPHGICVKEGWIYRAGDYIVCVPNRTVLRIEGVKRNEVDAVTR